MRCRFTKSVADEEHKKQLTPGHKKMPLGLKTVTKDHKKKVAPGKKKTLGHKKMPLGVKTVTKGHKKVPRGGGSRFDS